METKIKISISTLYHTLLHFSKISTQVESILTNAGYTKEQIDNQLCDAGSKFYIDFATSPQDVIDSIERSIHRSILEQGVWEEDNRCRLSFALNRAIGVANVVNIDDLTTQERSSIFETYRGGTVVRAAISDRTFETNLCQIIVGGGAENPELITIFPGALTPPIPATGYMNDSFWSQHIFIKKSINKRY